MPTSRPTLETRSDPTIDCFTGAIMLREGPAALGSTYMRDSSTPTSRCEPPPFTVRKSEFRAASPVMVLRRGPATERARRRTDHVIRARSLAWTVFAAFAIGATLAAFAGMFADQGGLEVAAVASVLAGTVTLEVALSNRRRARTC